MPSLAPQVTSESFLDSTDHPVVAVVLGRPAIIVPTRVKRTTCCSRLNASMGPA